MKSTDTSLPLGVSKQKSSLPSGAKGAVGFLKGRDAVAASLRKISSLNHLFEIEVVDAVWGRPSHTYTHRGCE